jgi:hypothetical protein
VAKTALVKHGPGVWREQRGPILQEDADTVVIELVGHDDAKDGNKPYEIRMPKACVVFDPEVEEPTT